MLYYSLTVFLSLSVIFIATIPYIFAQSYSSDSLDRGTHPKPNFLVIVADDVGFSDTSPYGGEVPTPNIDALAREGKVFTSFHVLPTCSPSRSELLTGVDNHLNGLGTMYEVITPNQIGKAGYETYLNDRVITVADMLKNAGYHTVLSGKWHLSRSEPENGKYLSEPSTRGFERTFTLLGGHSDHFNSDPPCTDCTQVTFLENGEVVERPDHVYSTDLYTDKMIDSIDEVKDDGKPLFMYLAYQVTHTPLQAPATALVDKYLTKYDRDWEATRNERFERQKALGVWPPSIEQLPEAFPPNPEWDTVTLETQEYWTRSMAKRAAMLDNMDFNIGKIITYLKDIGKYDNTFILFTSDNGGNGLHSVSVSPLSGFKGTMYEGGMRSPLIVKGPNTNTSNNDTITDSYTMVDSPAHVLDLVPTFLDYAQTKHPGALYNGKEIYVPTTGKSIRPLLEGSKLNIDDDDDDDEDEYDKPISRELFGNSAVFMGSWKAVRHNPPAGNGEWELFNILVDPAEKNNLAKENGEILNKMLSAYDDYAKEVGIVPPDGNLPKWLFGSLPEIYDHGITGWYA